MLLFCILHFICFCKNLTKRQTTLTKEQKVDWVAEIGTLLILPAIAFLFGLYYPFLPGIAILSIVLFIPARGAGTN